MAGLLVVLGVFIRLGNECAITTVNSVYASKSTLPNNDVGSLAFAPFLNMAPSSDGTEIRVSAAGVGALGGTLFANFLDIGPGGRKHSYTMTYSDTAQTYFATAVGFTPGMDITGTVGLTTTLGLETAEIQFQRAFVTPLTPQVDIAVEGQMGGETLTVAMPNIGTVPADTYLVVMATNAPPGPLPSGYRFASSTYAINPSGSLTETERLMTLRFTYGQTLPAGVDPHTLAVVGWNRTDLTWEVLGGDLFAQDQALEYVTKRFGIYALAATPTWRDSFNERELTGVSVQTNTRRRSDGTIVLDSGATSGALTSIPITPTTDAASWGTLHFSATIPLGADLRIDVLDINDQVLRVNVADGADLSDLPLVDYPSLKLRATLTTAQAEVSPELRSWQVSWAPSEQQQNSTYLPLVVR
ncbi:MAG: hypothetical protein MI924_28640 [Chloroflexales bacterium]|nr:hypothetical protein [Chloroflexales bacterium]